MSDDNEVLKTLRRIEGLLMRIANNTAKDGSYHLFFGTPTEQTGDGTTRNPPVTP